MILSWSAGVKFIQRLRGFITPHITRTVQNGENKWQVAVTLAYISPLVATESTLQFFLPSICRSRSYQKKFPVPDDSSNENILGSIFQPDVCLIIVGMILLMPIILSTSQRLWFKTFWKSWDWSLYRERLSDIGQPYPVRNLTVNTFIRVFFQWLS